MATKADIATVISKLAALFPNYRPDPIYTSEMFMQVLADLDYRLIMAATISLCANDGDFAPSAGKIRQEATRLEALAYGIPDAYRAYDEVVNMPANMTKTTGQEWDEEAKKYWINTTKLKWSHPIVETVAYLMGWPKSFPTDMPGVDRAQFTKVYDAEVARVMSEISKPKIVTEYIESRKAGGKILEQTINLTKKLEMKNEH